MKDDVCGVAGRAQWLRVAKHGRRIQNGTVLLVKIGEGHGMHFIGGAQATMEVTARKSETHVCDQEGLEAEIAGRDGD